jgi:predicted ferric reductase
MTLLEWYVARTGGMVAFGLLTLTVVAGLTLSGRARLRTWPRFAVEDVHRFLGVLTGTFVAIHVLALFVDAYLPFSVTQLLIPGTASYRPLPSALGVVGAELLVALAITNHFRTQLGHRLWRRAHYASFAVWGLALLHGVFAGSDTSAGWATALYVGATAAVAAGVVWRLLKPPAAARPVRATRRRMLAS